MNLQCTAYFLEKIKQIYQMIVFRHGLMIVGNTLSGKTSSYSVLANSLKALSEKNLLDENQVQICLLNPKSITTSELYGTYDLASHEWFDGILASIYRKFALDLSSDRKWIIFDGPVDAMWIENMNSVLDDNKKLCLMSGEIIKLPDKTNLIFETLDLEQASPATVSRCGMIYMEATSLGWRPLVTSWLKSLPKIIDSHNKVLLSDLYDKFVQPSLDLITINKLKKHIHPISESHLVTSLMKLNSQLITILDESNATVYNDIGLQIESIFFFSLVWSIGSILSEESRTRFDQLLKKLIKESNESRNFPVEDNLTCFDLKIKIDLINDQEVVNEEEDSDESTEKVEKVEENLVIKNKYWETWSDELNRVLKEYIMPKNSSFDDFIIPTVDKIRYYYFLNAFLRQNSIKNSSLLFIGATGTGKTSYTIDFLLKNAAKNKFSPTIMSFSAQTTSNQTQSVIMESLVKHRKGVYGPQINHKCVSLNFRLIIFFFFLFNIYIRQYLSTMLICRK